MNKSIFARVIASIVLALPAACDEGPNDNYQPAPTGAQFNNPKTPPYASDAGAPFAAADGAAINMGGTNKNDICNAPQLKAANAKYFSAPILPNIAGNIDVQGGPKSDGQADPNYDPANIANFHYDPTSESFTGVTIDQLEQTHCQATPESIFFGDTTTYGWGNLGELAVDINADTRVVHNILIQTGYLGALTAKSSDGKTTFTLAFNNQPPTKQVTGSPPETIFLPLNWDDSQGALTKLTNDLYDALRNTFAPTLPAESDCTATGHCIIGNNKANGGYLWFTPINMAFFVNTTVGNQLAVSTFTLLDIGAVKTLGFTLASSLLKLDPEGPLGLINKVFGTGANCKYHLGMDYAEFKSQCVEVFPDATRNAAEERKLFGGIRHNDETYSFDVLGVDPAFAATSLPANTVVGDKDRPQPGDTAFEYVVDQQVLGPIANDFVNNDATIPTNKDWHGLGLVTLQTANRVQQYMKKNYGVTSDLGDPECVAFPYRTAAQRTAAGALPPPAGTGVTAGKVCSGLEGIVTTAPPASVVGYPGNLKVNALGPAILNDKTNKDVALGAFHRLANGLKPGTWRSYFCADGKGLDAAGHPVGYDLLGVNGNGTQCSVNFYFSNFAGQVATAFTANGGSATPNALTDFRFFFQQWIFAVIQYLEVAANPNATLAQIDARPVSQDNLFFDSAGGGFEFAEYVDRSAVNAGKQPPTDLRITTNLLTSVIDDFSFTRFNYRGEKALYQSLTMTPGDYPGAEDVLLTNLVGSSVLVNTYGSYACAVNTDPNNAECQGVVGPQDVAGNFLLDDNGNPLLTKYAGAFGQSNFTLPVSGGPATPSPIDIPLPSAIDAGIYTDLGQAMVTVPKWSNPFDVGSVPDGGAPAMFSALIPYIPKGASVGFPVSIDGTRDKMVNTYNVDFSGVSVSANVDYDYLYAGNSAQVVIKAVETTDFLGLVFRCAEPNPQNPQVTDVLAVRMYTPAQDILDWFAAHPSASNDCDLIVRYSIYGNQPDFISTRATGVRFGINPGINAGPKAGRVVDVTLFDPNVVPSLGN